MLTVNFTPFPVLSTKRLILRRITYDDVDQMFIIRSDIRVMQYINRPLAKTPDDAKQFIDKYLTWEKNNEAINWGICIKDDPKLIGTICYWNIETQNYRAELGYQLLPEYHGKGIMQEALSAVLEYGFKTMQLHSVVAIVNPGNKPSCKILERNNFVREAYFKENYFFEGRFLDSVVYTLLTKEKSVTSAPLFQDEAIL